MRVLLDTNVILDALRRRPPWHVEAETIWEATRLGRLACAATVVSIANLFYIGRRIVGTSQAIKDVRTCLANLEIVTVNRANLETAARLPGSDFEDNIQIAVAIVAGLDPIVTHDTVGFVASPIPVLKPHELLAQIATG